MSSRYNIPSIIKGDTFNVLQFTLTINSVAEDLTNYSIACKFRRGGKRGTEVKSISVGSGITLSDPTNGVFVIDAFNLDWEADTYYYDIEFTTAAGLIDTYIYGTLVVNQDVTY